jgi:pimeloyl-ACP methyl ester carboxylesterase
MKRLFWLGMASAAAALLLLLACPAPSLAATDLQPPASMSVVTIASGGSRVNGIIYLAPGSGPHPVVIFLHGYPGNEKNLDLAQAVRHAGYQALYIDYRGMWGSGGTFSFAHGLEDTKAVLAWVREPQNAAKYHLDSRRISIVGHSFGGWLALMTGGQEPPSVCVAGLAAWNVGGAALRFPAHPDERASNLEDFRVSTDPAGGPVRASADDLLNEMVTHAQAWDYLSQAQALSSRALLLVAATRDTPDEDVAMHDKMARAVRDAGGHRVTLVQYEDDHPFSSHRLALAELITKWLTTDCAATQGAP